MDDIILTLCSNYNGNMDIDMFVKTTTDYFDIPSGKEIIYNDNRYYFILSGTMSLPTTLYVNDEIYRTKIIEYGNNSIKFELENTNLGSSSNMPFLDCFGAVKIEMDINGIQYTTKAIDVLISNTNVNNSVINMVHYIYDNCEKYLYEEHKNSSVKSGTKQNQIVSLEVKIVLLKKILKVYKESYHFLKVNPYTKLLKKERIDSFDKLQTVTPNTIRYIITHSDELGVVDYNTGIQYNQAYYQPQKTLIEYNSYSDDVYENRVIVGFLHSLIKSISEIIDNIQKRSCLQRHVVNKNGYIDSMQLIFSRSIKKLSDYLYELSELKKEFTEMYVLYVDIFNINGIDVGSLPIFTPVFRSVNIYRNIYQLINDWFLLGNYDLGIEELLLSFITTSKIYEYFCLTKLLNCLENYHSWILTEQKRFVYPYAGDNYINTRYNNCFVFKKETKRLTVYFQPVIYGNNSGINEIKLFRNTSTNSHFGNVYEGSKYTPDYLLKYDTDNHSEYMVLDAKFSTVSSIKKYQLQELVYKYLFSISTLNDNDLIRGLYIICGKNSGNDTNVLVHDIASRINKEVEPFAELLIMNGMNLDDYTIPSIIINKIENDIN